VNGIEKAFATGSFDTQQKLKKFQSELEKQIDIPVIFSELGLN